MLIFAILFPYTSLFNLGHLPRIEIKKPTKYDTFNTCRSRVSVYIVARQ
jgi:hypothetical protein